MLQKKRFRHIIYILFISIFLFLNEFSTNKSNAETYKVQNIEIVEPYDLDFNKNKIIDKAFKEAFLLLISKITLSNDKNYLKDTKINKIKRIIDSFSIKEEKFVDNNYFASFEVDFNKKKLLNLLNNKRIISSIPIEKKIFILPILVNINKNEISLYSENNFYNNWNKKQKKYYLLKYILPNEDLEDLNILQSKINNIEDYEFQEIVSKYNLNDYIISIFFKNKNKMEVLSKIKISNELIIIKNIYNEISLNDEKNINDIIYDLKQNYENQWKKLNAINTSIKLSLNLSADSNNVILIDKLEKYLSRSDFVSKYNIVNFSSENTIYKIIYNNTPDKFLLEFRENGFKIDTSYKIWEVK